MNTNEGRETMLSSINQILQLRACEQASAIAYTFLADGETEKENITYQELYKRSQAVAAQLGSICGGIALLLFPAGVHFISSFLGCLSAGVIAVPLAPPHPQRDLAQFRAVVEHSQASVALAPNSIVQRLKPVSRNFGITWLAIEDIIDKSSNNLCAVESRQSGLAYLQYTSGSTGAPKGVMISHENIIHNLRYIGELFGHSLDSISVCWLPHFHDMGLIYGILEPVYYGFRSVTMSPMAFIQNPVRWLRAISKYRATQSGGPDFAYDLCSRKVSAFDKRTLDLSSWRIAVNGAQPIRRRTLDDFIAAFGNCGFNASAFRPAYGLAEATLKVSCLEAGVPLAHCTIDGATLEHGQVRLADSTDPRSRSIVSCGTVSCGMEAIIVDPKNKTRCIDGNVGEIWVAGPSVALGYWRDCEETNAIFRAKTKASDLEYLRTGDLGFLKSGELFVTGRLKDLIIVRGKNYYAEDIERIVENSHVALRRGCGAAFPIEIGGQECLVIAQEVERCSSIPYESVCGAIRRAVALEQGLQVHTIALLKSGTIPKTSSGKVRRHLCRALYFENRLGVVALDVVNASGKTPRPGIENETRASEIVAHLLKVDSKSLDPEEPLISYGLDSLVAAEVSNAIKQTFGVTVPVTDLLDTATLRDILSLVERGQVGQESFSATRRV